MHDWLMAAAHNPIAYAIATAVWTAAKMDYDAFETWQTPEDALAYDWKIAGWRWFKAAVRAVVVVLSGAGLVSLTQ